MQIYKIAQTPKELERDKLFDYLVSAGEINPQFKDGWLKRAEQVLNGTITDEFFAIWLMRNQENQEYGKLAKELADTYWNSVKKQ